MAEAGILHELEDLLPLVDSGILADLEEQLDGAELALRFARDYAAMWDQRYRRLALAVENQDRASALDAIISLRITSAMVGGLRLARGRTRGPDRLRTPGELHPEERISPAPACPALQARHRT